MSLRRYGTTPTGTFLQSNTPLRRSPLKKRGRISIEWEAFRNAEFEKDKDDEGLIRCQDYLIGLARCGIARSEMDLHHTKGREGKLLFDKSKMVWLIRECHGLAHE